MNVMTGPLCVALPWFRVAALNPLIPPPQSAVGHDYQSSLSKHCSQTDTSKGFGGKFGVMSDRIDQVRPLNTF